MNMTTIKNAGCAGRMAVTLLLLLAVALLPLSGCASRGGKTYSDGEVRTIQKVRYGTVLSVGEVTVEEDPSLVGPIVGGLAGGVVGSFFGRGVGRTLFILGGAAAGAVAGGAAEYGLKRYTATEITVELDDGEIIVIAQQDDEVFVQGDKVRVLTTQEGRARVQHR